MPDRAEPGDHAAGITASVLSVQSGDDGASVGVESRVGFRVLTRVKGEITPAAAVNGVSPTYTTSWNPLRPGDLTVTFDVVNEGNTRLLAKGVVDAGGQQVAFPAEGENAQELLPGDTRTLSVVVEDVWPLFVVPANVTLARHVIHDGRRKRGRRSRRGRSRRVGRAVAAAHRLAGIALLVLAILGGRVRSRRRLDTLLAEAREEGRKDATAAAVLTP